MSSERRHIGVVEDDPPLLRFYSALVEVAEGLELAFAASTLAEARAAIDRCSPDLCLIDLGLPDGSGIEIVRELKKYGRSRILVSTVLGDRATVMAALKAGADGYILKSMGQNELLAHIRDTLNGFTPISPRIASYLLELLKEAPQEAAAASTAKLTQREAEILAIFGRGLTYEETAAALGVSANTVRDFVKKIYAKLDVHSRSEAVYEAAALGLIDGTPAKRS